MLARIIRRIRVTTVAMAAILAGGLIVVGTTGLYGTPLAAIVALQEEPCSTIQSEYCTPGPHEYQGGCEGIDCYSDMEFCCIEMQ